MDEKKLEQEYKKLKQQAAPDLWDRIEKNLTEHPKQQSSQKPIRRIPAWRPVYGMAAAAAVVVVVLAGRNVGGGSATSQRMLEETMAAAGAAPREAAPEYEMAEIMEEIMASDNADGLTENSFMMNGGILSYEDLDLAAYKPLAVPEQAVTVPEDTQYFSEAVLGDTGLLCGGTVTDVSLEQDASGRAVKVVYEISVDQVYYAEDYTTGMQSITVKSPIVETEGDEAFILYQLQKDGTYLLPLENRDGGWELLYPFAPQIQVTGDGAYLFHSGYASLVNDDASVVIGSQEGDADYYYDRMLLRDDDNFLSDLISLVEREAQGRK